jgi:hypothetical protein
MLFEQKYNLFNSLIHFLLFFILKENKIRRKHLRSLASLHYEKALKLFSPHDSPLEYLRLLIEEVALSDFELQSKRFIFIFIF